MCHSNQKQPCLPPLNLHRLQMLKLTAEDFPLHHLMLFLQNLKYHYILLVVLLKMFYFLLHCHLMLFQDPLNHQLQIATQIMRRLTRGHQDLYNHFQSSFQLEILTHFHLTKLYFHLNLQRYKQV